jgi:hypothetical protein
MVDLKATDLQLRRQLTVFTAGQHLARSCVGQHARERCVQTVEGDTGLEFLYRTLVGEVNKRQ